MAGRLKQFVKKTKDKKDEENKRQQEVIDQALAMVPRCELNADLPEDASGKELWKAVHKNFQWNFGPSKGKSLKDTKTQFLKWAVRKLKDPVRTICHVELMMREKKIITIPEPGEGEKTDESGEAASQQSQAETPTTPNEAEQ